MQSSRDRQQNQALFESGSLAQVAGVNIGVNKIATPGQLNVQPVGACACGLKFEVR